MEWRVNIVYEMYLLPRILSGEKVQKVNFQMWYMQAPEGVNPTLTPSQQDAYPTFYYLL